MQDANGKLICKLLFTTLKNTDWNNQSHENVSYLICQGWLDILQYGASHVLPNKLITSDSSLPVTCKLDASDTVQLLKEAAKFLNNSLSIGNFEGISGAKQDVMLKL